LYIKYKSVPPPFLQKLSLLTIRHKGVPPVPVFGGVPMEHFMHCIVLKKVYPIGA